MAQPKRPDPLYSPLGCGAAALLVIALGIALYLRGGEPFSPGPLSAAASRGDMLGGAGSHADLEGQCAQCHEPWRGAGSHRCEQCHQAVAEQRQSGTGLHGRLSNTGRCTLCHTEHQGAQANINRMDLTAFDHNRLTGFNLDRHQLNYDGTPLLCADCHRERQWLAETATCLPCHTAGEPLFTQEHAAFFGYDCRECHDGVDRMVQFDHQAVFPLEGVHGRTPCAGCHQQQQFAGTPTDCAGCHAEPTVHAGLFGLDCARCHSSEAWRPARLTRHTFPLDHGGEGAIPCQSCHQIDYTAYTCYNCHEHDPAETRERHARKEIFDIQECAACHPTGREDEAKREP
jgi:hypothetical protein